MGESNEMGAQLGRPLLWLVLLRDLTALFSQLPSLPDAGDLRLDTNLAIRTASQRKSST